LPQEEVVTEPAPSLPPTPEDMRALLDKATPRPWHYTREDGAEFHRISGERDVVAGIPNLERFDPGDRVLNDANAALICAAVNALPAHLDALATLARENEALRDALRETQSYVHYLSAAGGDAKARKAYALEMRIAALITPTTVDAALSPRSGTP
jgi:hypothetical protein